MCGVWNVQLVMVMEKECHSQDYSIPNGADPAGSMRGFLTRDSEDFRRSRKDPRVPRVPWLWRNGGPKWPPGESMGTLLQVRRVDKSRGFFCVHGTCISARDFWGSMLIFVSGTQCTIDGLFSAAEVLHKSRANFCARDLHQCTGFFLLIFVSGIRALDYFYSAAEFLWTKWFFGAQMHSFCGRRDFCARDFYVEDWHICTNFS